MTAVAKPDYIDGPAVLTPFHKQDRELSIVAGAPKGFRRIDRLQWLFDHKTIQEHQLAAGRRFQDDWQMSKIEPAARMVSGGGGGGGSGNLSDARCDAIDRLGKARKALSVLPQSVADLTMNFLAPEDHSMSLEKCAAAVRINQKAASLAIQISLTLLAKHYGYAS